MTTRTDEVYVGRYYGQREVEITPDLVQTYLEGVNASNPWYTGESPFAGAVAPALVLHSEVFRDISWYLSIYGNLHARQEWEIFHPVLVGDTVTTRSVIVDRYLKRDREYVVNETTCYGVDGCILNRGRTHQSFLRRTGGGEGSVVDKDREKRSDRKFTVGGGDSMERIEGPSRVISLDMCQKFSGPHKNYHNDVDEARKLGFPDIVVQGMMSLCFISEMMTERFGTGWYGGGRMNVNLVNVLWQGEAVRPHGSLRELLPEGPRKRAVLDVWCEKSDGTKIVVGTASAIAE